METNHSQAGAKIECGNDDQKISEKSPCFFTLYILNGYKGKKTSQQDVDDARKQRCASH
jgi:hypothetical protein